MKKFKCIIFGCKVNNYEAQSLMNSLDPKKYEMTETDDADIFVIYTCAVTNAAESKTRRKINSLKTKYKDALIVVVGCYVQIKKEELKDDLLIDIIVGSKHKNKIPELIDNYYLTKKRQYYVEDLKDVKFESLNIAKYFTQKRAYLKIQDGCNQYCSFCVIPYARGKERSMELEEVVKQAHLLVKNGHREIVLAGIHTGRYLDSNNNELIDLLKELLKVKGLERLRLSSIEISEITDEIIELMVNNKVLARHLHIPIQAGSDEMLKKMNRPYTIDYFRKRVAVIRSKLANISISTDLIVGFPNESEELFNQTYQFIKEIEFSFIHCFPYARKKGTKADELEGHISDLEKKNRASKINELSKSLNDNYAKKYINQVKEVLVEKQVSQTSFGHSSDYLPIYLNQVVKPNEIVNVKIIKYDDQKLIGEVTNVIK